jgi:hypothetical protein
MSAACRLALGLTQCPIQWVLGGVSPEVKCPGCEADDSPSSGAEVKNDGAVPLLPHTFLWCLVN